MAGVAVRLLSGFLVTAALCGSGTVMADEQDAHPLPRASSQDSAPGKADVSPAMQRLWTVAMRNVRNGDYRTALPQFERLVSAEPDETQFRLELARTLFLIGVDDRAQYHFNLALGDSTLSDADVALARRYLDQIAARSAWSGQFSLAIVPESNPAQRPSAETVSIGDLSFTLSPDARARSGTGVSLDGRLRWSPRLSRDWRGRLGVSGRHEAFRESAFNDSSAKVIAGADLLADRRSRIGLALTYRQRWIAGEPFSYGPGVEMTAARRLSQATRGSARLSVSDLHHDNLTRRDGLRTFASLGVEHAVTQRLVANASVFAKRANAQAASEAYREIGIQVGGRYGFRGGLLTGLQTWVVDRQNDAEERFFLDARENRRWGATVSVSHRQMAWKGFAPELSLTYETRRSNITLYDYENVGLSLGVTRDF